MKDWLIKHKVIVIIIVIFLIALAAGNNGNKKQEIVTQATPVSIQSNQNINNNTTIASVQQSSVFDLETVKGKSIDEIRTIFGTPTDGEMIEPTAIQKSTTTEWSNSFEKEGYSLLVTYNPNTRSIIDFFLSSDGPTGQDLQKMKDALNVANSTSYIVEPVKALKDPSTYTGIKVTSK